MGIVPTERQRDFFVIGSEDDAVNQTGLICEDHTTLHRIEGHMAQQYLECISYGYATAIGGSTKNIVNVYNFQRLATVNPVSKANIEAAFQTNIMVPVLAALSVSYTQTQNTVRFFDDALDAPTSFTETGVGGISGDRLPDYSAVTLQMKSTLRGRSYNGSKHFGPIAESDTLGDTLVAGAVTRFNAIGSALVSGFTDSDGNLWLPVIKSSRPPANYRTNPTLVLVQLVAGTRLNKSLGTMRRRKIRTVN